jgi:hypothetical protein
MSERNVLGFSFAVFIVLMAAVLGGLALVGASSGLLVTAYLLLLIGGSYTVSRVATRHRS